MNNIKNLYLKLGVKVSDKNIDAITTKLNSYIKRAETNKTEIITIDFSELTWISNQELLIITSYLVYFIKCKVHFEVKFLKEGWSSDTVDKRRAKQLIEIWEVWKISQISPDNNFDKYFDIDGRFIERLKKKFGIELKNQKIYNRYGVTPFVRLPKIENYDDKRIGQLLNEVYRLNKATLEILKSNSCDLPIASNTLSQIITKELYENFLDHFKPSIFDTNDNEAFMSLSLKTKFNEDYFSEAKIEKLLQQNFEEENVAETLEFYYNKSQNKFINQSILQFSFLDFGIGIPKTLEVEYSRKCNEVYSYNKEIESKILDFAFKYDSSRNPIDKKFSKNSNFPRGLFDLLSVVKRFEGLLIARSNYGKLIYDFSNGKDFENAKVDVTNNENFFPGTLISIYIAQRKSEKKLDRSVIKPFVDVTRNFFDSREIRRLSLSQIIKETEKKINGSEGIYNTFLKEVTIKLSYKKSKTLVYFDFNGYELDERLTKKLIYFLISDYNINHLSSCIVINPPPIKLLIRIRNEIFSLSEIIRDFYIHPTPFIYYNDITKDLSIYWLGVSSEQDINKLNNLLFDIHDLRKDDFEIPDDIIGNVNYYDEFGNLKSLVNPEHLNKIFQHEIYNADESKIKKLIKDHIRQNNKEVYLCISNYYQNSYFEVNELLKDENEFNYLCEKLFERIHKKHQPVKDYKFVAITHTSQKILKYFRSLNFIQEEQIINLESYFYFQSEQSFKRIIFNDKIVLVCDVISSGRLVLRLDEQLKIIGAELLCIAVFLNGIDTSFEPDLIDYSYIISKIVSLENFTMEKYRRKSIKEQIIKDKLDVIRIDPYSNTPIVQTINHNSDEAVLITNEQFINLVLDSHIKAGYFKFNNLIHPYFFDMDAVLSNKKVGQKLLSTIFNRIKYEYKKEVTILFYPKNSGIHSVETMFLKETLFRNHKLVVIELERFSTNEGWRFSHTPQYLSEMATGQKAFIIDDGSCSGESIIQMIDEVAILGVKEIVVVSIIGRVNEHKRDFFSRIKLINNKGREIKLTILFGCHWHVPTYYIEESPIIQEKRWLENVLKVSNIPLNIKITVERIQSELLIKDISQPSNEYLLENKDGSPIIKELILAKEQIGKITSFRFFKEYFSYFDNLVLTYDDNKLVFQRYRKIEIVCAVFLHEPEIFEKIKEILPDFVEKLQEFIQSILFGNSSKLGAPKLAISKLYYKWSIKNLLHLFFIVYRDENLFKLLDVTKLIVLIKEVCKSHSDLSYLFYRLLKYIPLNDSEVENFKFGGRVKYLLEASIEYTKLDNKSISQLKVFNSFISTLPFDELDFKSHLVKIKEKYLKVSDDKFHNEYIYNDKQVLVNQLSVLYKKLKDGIDFKEEVFIIKKAWTSISSFIEDLLKFSVSYPGFFIPLNDEMLDRFSSISHLRTLHSELRDLIYPEKFSDISRIKEGVDYLFDNYIMATSDYYKIFFSITTPEVEALFNEFVLDIKQEYSNLKLKITPPTSSAINFPKIYLSQIVFKEIIKNLRYADHTKEIEFSWSESTDYVTLKIANSINPNMVIKGGGKGITKLNKMNSFPVETKYRSSPQKTSFIQNLRFSKL